MNQSLTACFAYVNTVVDQAGVLSVQLCTFQRPSGNFDTAGAAVQSPWQDVAGLANLQCKAAPPSDARLQATEVRALGEITASELLHIFINQYLPQIGDGWRGDDPGGTGAWRVMVGDNDGAGNLINGYAYDIMGVEWDSEERTTRVQAKLATI